jgi:hypothetical protein
VAHHNVGEHTEGLEQLEEAADEEAESDDIPSGDSIARDLQRFLSQQDPDET